MALTTRIQDLPLSAHGAAQPFDASRSLACLKILEGMGVAFRNDDGVFSDAMILLTIEV